MNWYRKAITDRSETNSPRKEPGRGLPIVSTPGALNAFPQEFLRECIGRFKQSDFGDIGSEDLQSNLDNLAYNEKGYMMGVYQTGSKTLWIICDGVAVTLLLPEEY